jgi:hemerythrin
MSDVIEWKDSYIVDFSEIDSQHKRIFQLLNKLAAAVDAGKSHSDLTHILSDVLNHFRSHFTSEEDYLKNHPDFDIHHQLHCDFTEKGRKFEEQTKIDEKFDFEETSNLLAGWFKDHILQYDVKHFYDLLEKTAMKSTD